MTKAQRYYRRRKNALRVEAIEWQMNFENQVYSWGDIADWGDYFYTYGKRYGLLREFRENAII